MALFRHWGHLGFTQGCIVFVQFFLVVAGFLFHLVQLALVLVS